MTKISTSPLFSRLTAFYLSFIFVISACNQSGEGYYKVNGFAQGTTYQVTYRSEDEKDLSGGIDSLLQQFDLSLSTYKEESVISRINRNKITHTRDKWFLEVVEKARDVYKQTGGAFDITLAPVIDAWGFGVGNKENTDSLLIDSLLQLVGMDKFRIIDTNIVKSDPGVTINVNAIAQGYSVDVIAAYLDSLEIPDYLVEVGGEVRTRGHNPNGEWWSIGIDKPFEGNFIPGEDLQAIISMENQSLATSGNYRKFYEEDGVKYSHTIDPKTGFPVRHSLLSATVIANDCMTADAYATAFMVMGLERAKRILQNHKELQAYFIYDDGTGNYKTFMSEGLEKMIKEDIPSD